MLPQCDLGVLDNPRITGAGIYVGFLADEEVDDQLGQESGGKPPEYPSGECGPGFCQRDQEEIDSTQHQSVGDRHYNAVKEAPGHQAQVLPRVAQGHHLKPISELHTCTAPFPILQRSRRRLASTRFL